MTWSPTKRLLIILNHQLYGLDVPVSIQCKKGKRNVYITSTWYLLYRIDDWTDRHWRRNYLILVSLDEAYENDIGWPTEIILAKLIKWPEINIFAKLTQMLITCVFTSFHKRGKRSTYQRTQLKSLCLTRRIKTSLNRLYTTIILLYTDYRTEKTCCHDK